MGNPIKDVTPVPKLLWSLQEAGAMLSLSYVTMFRMYQANKIKTVRLGRAIRVPYSELQRIAGGGEV